MLSITQRVVKTVLEDVKEEVDEIFDRHIDRIVSAERDMTREEAIKRIQDFIGWFKEDSNTYKALEMAIQALSQEPTNTWSIKDVADTFKKHGLIREQEPCDDAISRDELLKAIDTWDKFGYTETGCFVREPKGDYVPYIHYDDVIKCIKALPSVTQKSGKWIPINKGLPEDKTYVLTTIKVPNRIAHARSSWYEGGFFHNDNGDTWRATDMEVKAWMPLPKPYKPQESEDKE